MQNKRSVLVGRGASAGIAQGKVQIIHNPQDCANFRKGNILVTKITNPSMIMAISKAKAIVTEIGGTTSHPSIISRELGIPCVVAVKKATLILKDRAMVKVNGETGEIFLMGEK